MYAIIDIEGNGGPFRKEKIIEIAIFRFDGHKVVDQFFSLVNPCTEITPYVQKLTNISLKMVKTAPKFHEIAKRIVEITEGATLVGHNIDFDYRLLRQEFRELGFKFKAQTLDTIPLSQKLFPNAPSYSLGKLVKSLGIPLVNPHRAAGDARATLELFKMLLIKDQNLEIIQKHFEETNAKTYFNKIKELTQDLPSDMGIIYFQNEQGKILYTDFVQHLNRFAKKILNSPSKKWKNIQKSTQQISFEKAGNPLIAKLLMATKGIKKNETLPFGLYFHHHNFSVEKCNLKQDKVPILKFKSYTQGLKVLKYIQDQLKIQLGEDLENTFKDAFQNRFWLAQGRSFGEKFFLEVQNGVVLSYGFYEFHTQVQSPKIREQLKISLPNSIINIENELKMGVLKGDFTFFNDPVL